MKNKDMLKVLEGLAPDKIVRHVGTSHLTHSFSFWSVVKFAFALGLVYLVFWFIVASAELFALRWFWQWFTGQ